MSHNEKQRARETWRLCRRVLDLVPNSRRTLALASVSTCVNGASSVLFGLSFGPAFAAAEGAASTMWMFAPAALLATEYATSIHATNRLIEISEKTRLRGVLRIVDDVTKPIAHDDDDSAADVMDVVTTQLDKVRNLVVDVYRWSLAQVSRLGTSVVAVAVMTANGASQHGVARASALVIGATAASLGVSVVAKVVSLKLHRQVEDASVELHKKAQRELVETDAELVTGLGGLETTRERAAGIGIVAEKLHDFSSKARHWAKRTSNASDTLMRLALASLPLLATSWFGLKTGIASQLIPAVVLGYTIAPAAQIASEYVMDGIQTIQNAAAKIGRQLERLETQSHRGDRQLSRDRAKRGVLSLEDVSVRRTPESGAAPITLLDGVSLTVRPGEIVVIEGPSGAGKTTLLQTLLGIHLPQAGRARLGTVPLAEFEAKSLTAQVRLMKAELRVPDDVTVEDVLALDPAARAMSDAERRERSRDALVQLGLDGIRLARRWDSLSGGERQRVVLAQLLLMSDAPIVGLDEPTTRLDGGAKQVVARAVRRANEAGRTVVVITHDREFVDSLGEVRRVRVDSRGPGLPSTVVEVRPEARSSVSALDARIARLQGGEQSRMRALSATHRVLFGPNGPEILRGLYVWKLICPGGASEFRFREYPLCGIADRLAGRPGEALDWSSSGSAQIALHTIGNAINAVGIDTVASWPAHKTTRWLLSPKSGARNATYDFITWANELPYTDTDPLERALAMVEAAFREDRTRVAGVSR